MERQYQKMVLDDKMAIRYLMFRPASIFLHFLDFEPRITLKLSSSTRGAASEECLGNFFMSPFIIKQAESGTGQ